MLIMRRGDGRLGNQLFQIWGLISVSRKPGEKILINHVESALDVFDIESNIVDYGTGNRWFNQQQIIFLLRVLGKLSLLNKIGPPEDPEAVKQFNTASAGRRQIFVDGGFFFNFGLLDFNELHKFKINNSFHERANTWISPARPAREPIVFVHVRRGDYLEFKGGVDLPREYYATAISEFIETDERTRFVFCTDDISWLEDSGLVRKKDVLIDDDVGVCVAAMLQCDGGVMSNSSLSFFSACKLLSLRPDATIIGPEYYIDWKSGKWPAHYINTPRIRWLAKSRWASDECE